MSQYYVASHVPEFIDEATLKALFDQKQLAKTTGYDRPHGGA